jgi:transcriptional regulator with GAF, ATPase, and Fis domain
MDSISAVHPWDFEERLRFEMLLTEVSARFVSATPRSIDAEIVDAQKQIVQVLGLDRSTLGQLQEPGRFVVTHCWAAPGYEPVPGLIIKDIPWLVTTVAERGEEVHFTRIDDLPAEAERDKEILRRFGPYSSAIFPFKVGGKIIGAMAFGTVTREHYWTDDVLNRLRLLVEIIGNGIARTRAEDEIRDALEENKQLRERLERENCYLQQEAKSVRGRAGLIGESPALRNILAQVERVAATNSNVLLTGETGTGKEMLASAIHELSLRRSRAMVRVSCAAIPDTLVESELFGREKGAYTGAMSRQVGRFELAHGSTLFLDEVGELSLEVQAKLLRVLEERRIERLGSPKSISVDVRIIAATNRDLEKAVREKRFRDDLFYRLNVFPIRMPALRERPEDIPLLVYSFLREFAVSMGKGIEEIDEDSLEALRRYSWPGNIRELRNVVERAVIMSTSRQLNISPPVGISDEPHHSLLRVEVERQHVLGVLEMSGWRVRGKNGAAELLGMKPTTLDSMIARLGITRSAKGGPS